MGAPDARPSPQADPVTAFFWEGCARGELLVQHCPHCERFIHPPSPRCPACGREPGHRRVSGRGAVHSFTVTHRALPGFEPPFAVVLIALDDAPGVRLVSNLVDVEPEAIEIGIPVEVVFETVEPGTTLPLFRRRDA